jgi:hypothetical protein
MIVPVIALVLCGRFVIVLVIALGRDRVVTASILCVSFPTTL